MRPLRLPPTLLGQPPVQAESRENLKSLLKVASGGIVFTTIQKFFPKTRRWAKYDLLSERRNIIVMADEAHRTQYGFEAKLIDTADKKGKRLGLRFLPNTCGTPCPMLHLSGLPAHRLRARISILRRSSATISMSTISPQAVEDGATVKIYYESRLAKVNLTEEGRRIIEDFERERQDDELSMSQKAKAKWSKLEAIVGHPERLKNWRGTLSAIMKNGLN